MVRILIKAHHHDLFFFFFFPPLLFTIVLSIVASIPGEEDAMSLAAPAVAIANQSKPVGHTAPLLPTPPTVTSVLGAAGIVPSAPVS